MRFPAETIDALLPHLRTLIRATHANDGCIAYDVGQDALEPGVLRFSELWPDVDSFKRHSTAPHIAPWRQACQDHGIIERKFAIYEASEISV